MVSGYGKENSSAPSNIPKEVDVPLIPHEQCQQMLRKTNLSRNFKLDADSFLCAGKFRACCINFCTLKCVFKGGEAGKDACTGDGGSPLSCYIVSQFIFKYLLVKNFSFRKRFSKIYRH